MLRVAICDDNEIAREQLQGLLHRKKEKWDLEWDSYASAEELLEGKEKGKLEYNLFILDIMMPGMNGIELADKIMKEDKKAIFVFETNFDHYALPLLNKNMNIAGYLMKPITEKNIEKAFQKYTDMRTTEKKFRFSFKFDNYQLDCESIIYIARDARYVTIVTDHGDFKSYLKQEEIWEQLDENYFASPHVSFIVNLKRIIGTRGNEVLLDNGVRIPLSRSLKQEFKDKYLDFLEVV